ncbi:MAG: TonB C-terminal domain-containing protein [Verrucomicrobiales bacterium]|nr:TonB C-terminal domain-containing protein [Verrucomicrobiales bacterium]
MNSVPPGFSAEPRSRRIGLAVSMVLHGLIIAGLIGLAAREGMLGEDLHRIAVTLVPKPASIEPPPPPSAPPESPPPPNVDATQPSVPDPAPEIVREEPSSAPAPVPALTETTSGSSPNAFDIAGVVPAGPTGPAIPGFEIGGAQVTRSDLDASHQFKGYVEHLLRSAWRRPAGLADSNYVAEIDVSIDPHGTLVGTTWRRGSGNAAWDASVRQALSLTRSIGRPPPRDFPASVLVRFDVPTAAESAPP